MELNTSRFGALEVDPTAIITFTQPIIGFQEYRRFVLLPGPPESAVSWLQSTDAGDLAFLLMNPRQLLPEYRLNLPAHELSELAVGAEEELEVYTLLVVPEDRNKIRTNLKAPILINLRQRLGKQTVLERSEYPIQFFLAQARKDQDNQEITNAGADA